MAKKDNIGLLNEIVGQLRMLNRSSVRDQLKENEALKRSEALMGQGEETALRENTFIDSGTDFQRRFLAGQAKTFTDKTLQKQGSKLAEQVKIREEGQRSADFLASIGAELMHVRQILEGTHKALPNLSIPIEGPLLENVNPAINVETARHTLEMQESLKLLAHKASEEGSFYVHDVLLLDYFKGRDNELDRQRNTDIRSAEEARREAIRLAGKGAGGIGAGAGAGFGKGEGEGEGEEGGGLIGWLLDNKSSVGVGTGLTLAAIFRKWFGFGTKAGFMTTMKNRFKNIAGKLFPKSKYGFIGPKLMAQKGNPRMWPYIFVAGIATAFIQSTKDIFGTEPEEVSTEGGGHHPQENDSIFTISNAITAALWAPLFYKKGFLKTIKNRFSIAGKKMFPKSIPKLRSNPRMWPYIFAAGIATAFLQATKDVGQEFEEVSTANDNATPAGYTDPADEGGIFTTGNVLTAAIWAPLIYKGVIKTKIGQGMKTVLTKMYSKAPAGSARSFIWTRMIGSTAWGIGGRTLAAAFGPWGMAAFIAYGIIDWRMDVIKEQQRLADIELEKEQEVHNQTGLEPSLTALTLGEYNVPLADANADDRVSKGEQETLQKRKQDMRAKVIAMLKTTKGNAVFRDQQIAMLLDKNNLTGWTVSEVNAMVHAADRTKPAAERGTWVGKGKFKRLTKPWDPSGEVGKNAQWVNKGNDVKPNWQEVSLPPSQWADSNAHGINYVGTIDNSDKRTITTTTETHLHIQGHQLTNGWNPGVGSGVGFAQ